MGLHAFKNRQPYISQYWTLLYHRPTYIASSQPSKMRPSWWGNGKWWGGRAERQRLLHVIHQNVLKGSHASPMAAPLLRPHYSYQLPSEYCVTFIRRWVPYSMVLQHTCPGVQNSPLHVFPSNWSVNPTGQLQWTPVDVSLHVRSQPPLLTAHVSSQQ